MKARTVCCGKLIDIEKGTVAKKDGEEYLVCSENCKTKFEAAKPEEMEKMKMELRREQMNEISRDTKEQGQSARSEMEDVDREN